LFVLDDGFIEDNFDDLELAYRGSLLEEDALQSDNEDDYSDTEELLERRTKLQVPFTLRPQPHGHDY